MNSKDIAFVLLASGLSSRFSSGDKLLAQFGGIPLIARIPTTLAEFEAHARIAVIGSNQTKRAEEVSTRGWAIVDNPDPAVGQFQSLALGMKHVIEHTEAKAALILLADMPNISAAHVTRMMNRLTTPVTAIMSRAQDVLMPPALFARQHLETLSHTRQDRGARAVFLSLQHTETVDMKAAEGRDIDTVEDLELMKESIHG